MSDYGVTVADLDARMASIGPLKSGQTSARSTMLSPEQGDLIIKDVEAVVNAAVASHGYSVPVSESESSAANKYLKSIVSYGAAAEVLKSRLPSNQGPNSDRGAWTMLEKRYTAGLGSLEGVLLALMGAPDGIEAATGGVSSTWTKRASDGTAGRERVTIDEVW